MNDIFALSALPLNKHNLSLKIKHSSLKLILKDLGFQWRGTNNNRQILIEKSNSNTKNWK
jgi:hypothetical protein